MKTPSPMVSEKKRKKKGKQQQQHYNDVIPNVSEATRIRIRQILEDFRASNDDVYTFEPTLTNFERAEVHVLSRKMGMRSKSTGSNAKNDRCISVYKSKKKAKNKESKDRSIFSFSDKGRVVLRELFTHYPPEDHEVGEKSLEKFNGNTDHIVRKQDDILRKPSMNKAEIAKKLASLASRLEKVPNFKQITEERSKLPIASFKDVITSTVESNQVVLISGETGCGKTTQVPQYILDYMWSKGEGCKVVCTQPRRISATSVAERISFERGENVGDSIGYKIRLESKGGRHSSIVFCTNGVLLRLLVEKGRAGLRRKASRKRVTDDFLDITHIIVDEIHERDRFSDFMLAVIRDMLPFHPHLRLVLMSATLDAERFSEYFGGCPIIRVPGFTYPVKNFFLEDVLSLVKSKERHQLDHVPTNGTAQDSGLTEECSASLDDAINLAWSSDEIDPLLDLVSADVSSSVVNFQHTLTGVSPLMVFARKGRVNEISMLLSFGGDCRLRDNGGKTALDWAELENHKEAAEIIRTHMVAIIQNSDEEKKLLDRYLTDVNPELIDVFLIEKLLRKVCSDSKEGAILVFLPGWEDINRARERLSSNMFFRDSSRFLILALHSMVPSVEQKKVFKRPPSGCRKIILSTNIAETAITIDDVIYVIDTGRMKEKSYDPYNNVSTLQSSWISKASAKQREGRAGRCQPGICYHLYSKTRAASLLDFQVPEIKRMPIEELCLQVKLLDPDCKINDFLKKTLDPPLAESIRNAITVLQDIGALSSNEELTELGKQLGSIPVHPLTSKMLFFAILFNCLDPALTLASASDYRDPFTLPMSPEDKKKASAAKSELASLYGGHGDQLAVIAAFECWKNAKQKGQEARFCSQYFVSPSVMNMLFGMRKQLQSELFRNGFIPEDSSQCSVNAQDTGIIHGVIVSGLYPMVGRLHPPKGNKKRCVVESASGERVLLHPQSVISNLSFKKGNDIQPLLMYDEITRGDGGLSIRKCCIIGPLPLLLLATEIAVVPAEENDCEIEDVSDFEESDEDEVGLGNIEMPSKPGESKEQIMSSPENAVKMVVDRWLFFESTALDVAQIYCLRERASAAILFKITHPKEALPELLEASISAIACILSYDGLMGMVSPMGSVDSLTSMVRDTDIGQSVDVKKEGSQNPYSYVNSVGSPGLPHYPTVGHHYGYPPNISGNGRGKFGSTSTAPRGDSCLTSMVRDTDIGQSVDVKKEVSQNPYSYVNSVGSRGLPHHPTVGHHYVYPPYISGHGRGTVGSTSTAPRGDSFKKRNRRNRS